MTAVARYAVRRCCLSVPASDSHKIDKALSGAADEVVLDLEDSVPPGEKAAARQALIRRFSPLEVVGKRLSVRVNAPGTPWCHADVAACAAAGPALQSIVVPKVESAGDLAFIDRLLDGVEAAADREERLGVQALVESAAGLGNLAEIVESSPRLEGLVIGYADLAASLGRLGDTGLDSWLPAQHQVLVAARSAGIAAVDGPYLRTDTDPQFTAAVARAAGLGFDGKWVIHPSQIDDVVSAFTPSPEQLGHAQRVVDALAAAHARGAGAVDVDGRMIDEALAVEARRVLARAGGAR
ncbi:HpcH/HpaI aldolase/citrate lyase family protein [Amycolatopsis echigonensis]|uniref:CoA ester lyase n=1 Tax=Amycolatopsis echigonensis TaxID=2576905 RepID=A0A8E2B8K7_9PSEU|nr:CoA ester lyase [Amycolatopsis echigonensis]MBB2505949.1 CoA ester lyase [Amycolatopsis echigonensis]